MEDFINDKQEKMERLDNREFTEQERKVIDKLLNSALVYGAALKVVQTKIEILREDFRRSKAYNPIEHIKMRIKQPNSILKKAYMRGIEITEESIIENINDLAGIRVVCTFKSDIYDIVEIIKKSKDLKIIKIKDYISNPKPSGYQSYHMIVEVPVDLIDGIQYCKVEIQLRTMAMDFWASLEHKIKYKYDWRIPTDIREELLECSKVVDSLDDKMLRLHRKVHSPSDAQIEPNL